MGDDHEPHIPIGVVNKAKKKKRFLQNQISGHYIFSHSDGNRYNSKALRDVTTLAHLAQNIEPGLSLYTVSPYCVKWKDVAVHVCEKNVPRSQIMYALNASLVGLCEADLSKVLQSQFLTS